jgi:O-methyltransferase
MTADEVAAGKAYLELLRMVLTDFHRIGPDDGSRFSLPYQPSLEERRALRTDGRDWPGQGETMIGHRRLEQFQTAIETAVAEDVPGDIMEAGVWRGGACILARATLRALGVRDRCVWLADSFCGLPVPDGERFPFDIGDEHHKESFLRVSRQEVEQNFLKYGLLDAQVRFLEGWFRETLPTAPVERLCVLRLDGDMYESTMVALESLYDRVSPRGFVIVDDYHAVPACRAAVDDFRRARGIAAELVPIDWSGHYWRIPDRSAVRLPSLRNRTVANNLDLWPGYASLEAERLTKLAQRAFEAGDGDGCEGLALQALAIDGNALPAHLLLSSLRNPGPDYLAHLAWIHQHLEPAVYLEIGVFKGESIALAGHDCRAIGVDPQPLVAAEGEQTLVAMTSDDFFMNGEADRLLTPGGFDLAFLDGCHLFEQILRDFIHAERYAAAGAWVVLHDTQPLDEATSAPIRTTTFYSGDGWKLLAVLRDLRPDLRVRSVSAAPTGLTIVDRLSPTSEVLSRRYDEVVERYSRASWNDYLAHRHELSQSLENALGALNELPERAERGGGTAHLKQRRTHI